MSSHALPLASDRPVIADEMVVQHAAENTAAAGWLRRVIVGIGNYRRRARSIRELQRLSDWQLNDLGYVRSDIPEIVSGLMKTR
jgi:uncharacterized protein YjiS (DUF1127 family)